MSKASVRLHPDAATEIVEIRDYLAELSPLAAEKFIERLQTALVRLAAFPEQGFHRPDLGADEIRFLILDEYLMAYAAIPEPPIVLALLHGHRHPRVMAAILRARGTEGL